MKKMIASTVALVAALLVFKMDQSFAASVVGTAKQVVTSAIAIAPVSDLDFGSAIQGDAAATVAPGTSDNAQNGSFNVTGQPGQAYTISLPADGTVTLATGAGGANQTIAVSGFASFPATTGTLSSNGNQTLLVGATRAALSATQVAGNYTATYTVTVVY